MMAYMFQFELPSSFSEEMESLIPSQKEHIAQLFLEERILSYSVSQRRTAIWCVVAAQSEQEAMEIVAGFPLHPYFTDTMCHPLIFHNTIPASMPEFSLN